MLRWIITFSVLVIIGSLFWPYLRELGIARLPGDMVFDLQGHRLNLPLATSLVVSGVVAAVWRLLEP
jgi:hypothetical protein